MVGLSLSYARSARPMNLQLRSRIGQVGLALLAVTLAATPAASPTPTATPEPISTATPPPTSVASPIAQPSPPAATQETPKELASRLAEEAWDFLTEFTQDVSPRASATHQERAAAEFLARELEAMGYEVELHPFTADVESSETLVGPEALKIQSLPLTRSGSGTVSGILVHVGKAFGEDIPLEGLEGMIAVIQRGNITFEEKVSRVAEAGALGAVIYNDRGRGLFRGTLMNQAPIPAVAVSREEGQAVLELMSMGETEASVSVSFETRNTQNVIADKPGTAGDGRVIVLGGHYDTVPEVPGANDNGSGIATLIAIAREVSEKSYPFTMRFIGFGSEELGLLGSRFYVDSLSPQEREATITMLNFDALGTGDVVGVLGDLDLISSAVEYGRANGIEVERRFSLTPGSSSDHASFLAAGIPVVFFLADDFSRIHTPGDTLEFVQPELMGNSAALAIHLLDSAAGP